jgi:hypothetical protein
MACGLLIALAWVLAPTGAAAKARNAISRWVIFRNGSPTPPRQCIGMKRYWLRFPFSSGHFCLVIFDPMVYPMDTAWLDGTIPADHFRHTRPAYDRELSCKGLVQEGDRNDALPKDAEPAHGDD